MTLHRDDTIETSRNHPLPDQQGVAPASPLRVGFWGTQSLFSQQVLTALLKHHLITGLVVPAAEPLDVPIALWRPPPPAADELLLVNNLLAPTIVQTAWHHQIPIYQVAQLRASVVAQWLIDAALDVICVACFPWRIPAALLRLPTYGFLNVHPSLLPAYRGPAPLFWQLRDGLSSGGVTVHWMNATFDTGPIAAQTSLPWPDGATSADLDRLCAATGALLLSDLLGQLARGQRPQQPQPPGGSQQGWPTAEDFRLDLAWSARHAYNFMCGTDEWRQPYPLTVDGDELWLRCALAYTPAQQLGQPLVRNGTEVAIQFTPGVLHALLG